MLNLKQKLQKNWDSHDDDLDDDNYVDGYRPNQINVNALHGKSQNATYITVHCTLYSNVCTVVLLVVVHSLLLVLYSACLWCNVAAAA